MINIALPKGRLGDRAYGALSSAGYGCSEYEKEVRKLVFVSDNGQVSYFWVKPADVSVYVERGAADIGICGKDIIEESEPDVYELLDTGFGKCTMCVCGRAGGTVPTGRIRVATKFPNIAGKYFLSEGRDFDIIKLNGSIELAPLLGISDVTVDIVETGTTLRENGLAVYEKISDISARVIANKSSYNFSRGEIGTICGKLKEAVKDD